MFVKCQFCLQITTFEHPQLRTVIVFWIVEVLRALETIWMWRIGLV
jgi:hypothetical protein